MIRKRVSWFNLLSFIGMAVVVGLIGISLPDTINFVNGFGKGVFYGHFASYVVSALLFWLLTLGFNFYVERESYFVLLDKWIGKQLIFHSKHDTKKKQSTTKSKRKSQK